MRPQRNNLTNRIDRVIRVQRIGDAFLILGWATVLLGIGVVLATVKYTPEQLAAILRSRPWTVDILMLLPAPAYFRTMGAIAFLAGVLLLAAGKSFRDEYWWY